MTNFNEDELMADLDEADRAGDTELANHIAGLLRSKQASAPEPVPERTWEEAGKDTVGQLVGGAIGMVSTPFDLLAPQLGVGQQARAIIAENESAHLKAKTRNAQKAIDSAEGFLGKTGTAISQYATDPALAAKVIAGNAANMLPGMAVAKYGLKAAAVVNSLMNGGGARGEAFREIYQEEIKKGKSDEEAKRIALGASVPSMAAGLAMGALSGGSGAEAILAGGAKKGLREAGKQGFKEIIGEQGEEVIPGITTNVMAGKDPLSGIPETVAQTLVGSAPGTGIAVGGSLIGKGPETPLDPSVGGLAREAVGEPEPTVETPQIDETPPAQGELELQNIAGGGEGGGMPLGRKMEVDENGMPIDIEGSLELQDTESGRTQGGKQKELWEQEDIGDLLAEEAKNARLNAFQQAEQGAEVGPPQDPAVQKQKAFAEAERANAAWKAATEDAAWKGANFESLMQVIANGGRDTSMEAAFQAALPQDAPAAFPNDAETDIDLEDSLPNPRDIGDPLLQPDGSIDLTPAKTFLTVLRENGKSFAAAWQNTNITLKDWAKKTFGPLIGENSVRGDAVRWKLMHDAAFEESMGEAATRNERNPKWNGEGPRFRGDNWVFGNQNEALFVKATASDIGTAAARFANAHYTTLGLKPYAIKEWTRAINWVSTVLPYLTRGTSAIYLYNPQAVVPVYLKYRAMLDAKMRPEQINQMIGQQFPEWHSFLSKFPTKNHVSTLEDACDENYRGFMNPISYGSYEEYTLAPSTKNKAGRSTSAVFINATILQEPIINTIGTVVHELAHARHWRRVKPRMLARKELEDGVEYNDQWTERMARQAQETARIKWASMYKKQINSAMGGRDLDVAAASLTPFHVGERAVPASKRASSYAERNAGAVGPSRLPSDADSYTNPKLEQYRAKSNYTVEEIWPETPETGDPEVRRVGEKAIADGVKKHSNSFLRKLSSLPDMDTTLFLKGLGDVSKDIWNNWGLRSGSYRGTTSTLLNPTVGDFVYAHTVQKFIKHAATEHANNAKARSAWEALESHYSADSVKLFGKLDVGVRKLKSRREVGAKQFAKDTKIALWFEKNPDQWHDGTNWYPTEAQMIAQGMNPKSAKVWRGVMDQYEQLWDTLENAVGVAGRHAVQRVPGYMPHTTMGQYKALAVRVDKDGKRVQYIAEIGGRTQGEANKNLELLKKYFAGQNLTFVVDPPEPGKYDVGATLEGLRKARDLAGNIEGLKKLAEIIEGNAARGVITHALDRSDVARFGHTLQRATLYGTDFGMDQEGQMEAVRSFREYVKAVNGYAERVKFVRDTLGPLDISGALDLPNLREAIFNNFKDYVGISNVNKLDTTIKSVLVKMGRDPRFIDHWVDQAQSGFAAFYLIGNVPFYVVNSMQATASLPVLYAKRAELRLQGDKKLPDIGIALKRGMARTKNIWSEKSRMADPVIKWAEEHGFLDPQAHEAMQPNAVGIPRDPITAGIDRKTRQISFVVGYEFYRQTMSHEQALERAGAFSKEVAVPYEKSVGKPSILNRLPVLGQAMTLFSTYPVHILSMLENQTKMAIAASKEGDYKAAAESVAAATSYALLQAGLFGMMALPFAGWLNDGIDELNKLMGKPALKNVQQMARAFDSVLGTNGLAQFGIVSKLLGYDVSSSAQGVQPTIPEATWRAVTILFKAMLLTGGAFTGRTTKQDVWDTVRTFPGQWRGPMEFLLRDYPETTLQEHFAEKGNPRTVMDQYLTALGVRSIQEKSQMTTDRLLATDQAIIARRFASIEERLKARGPTEKLYEELQQVAEEFQLDPTPIIQGYVSWLETKDLSPDLRRALKTNSLKGVDSYQRFLKEQGNEPMRAP